MTSRKLYQKCLLLYPASFRNEFRDEMLGMFEDCRAAQGSCCLLADVVLSAVKQQISRRSTSLQNSASLYTEVGLSPSLKRVEAPGIPIRTPSRIGGCRLVADTAL